MSTAALEVQLDALQIAIALEQDSRRRLVLLVHLADVELQVAHYLAQARSAEPLPRLLAQLATGAASAESAGQAIARDPSLAGQVAQVALGGQAGDVSIGPVAGRDIVTIYIGDRRE